MLFPHLSLPALQSDANNSTSLSDIKHAERTKHDAERTFAVDNSRWSSRNYGVSGLTLLSLLESYFFLSHSDLSISLPNFYAKQFHSPRHAPRAYFPPFLAIGGKQDDYFSKGIYQKQKSKIKYLCLSICVIN